MLRLPPMIAAVRVFVGIALALAVVYAAIGCRGEGLRGLRRLGAPLSRLLDHFASMTSDLTLLLTTLSIMTGAFVITGIPTKVGFILLEMAGVHLIAMVLVAFVFGALVGTGLPPAPTYIITALVIAPPMIKVGLDPWVIHFFAFFLGVWGELSPPTSVTAAVAAKIAGASFARTLLRALGFCISLFVLMAAVFARPELVVEPGMAQIGAFALVLASTIGITFSVHARYSDRLLPDALIRLLLGALSLVSLLHPSTYVAVAALALVAALVGYWFFRERRVVGGRVRAPEEV